MKTIKRCLGSIIQKHCFIIRHLLDALFLICMLLLSFLRKRLQSFVYAGKGLAYLLYNETHFQVHILIGFVTIFLGIWVGLTRFEWAIILLVITLVLCAEAFNSAIEYWVDWLSPERRKEAGKVKDIAAAAVLLAAIGAFSVGVIIFAPKFFSLQ